MTRRAIGATLACVRSLLLALCLVGCAHVSREQGGKLILHCQPADAEVDVDGIPRGLCSDLGEKHPLRLEAGMHEILVHKQGYLPYRTLFAPGGADLALDATLLRAEE